ncbi:hypothetical protein V2J09_002229 [Rumex salicifolius]
MEVLSQLVNERPVVIFSKTSCCMSHSMKQLISSYGANPTVYELDEIPNGRDVEKALKKLGCQPSVPAVFIGQRFVGGANDVISLQVRGTLVPLLMEAGAIWNFDELITGVKFESIKNMILCSSGTKPTDFGYQDEKFDLFKKR